MSVDIVVPSLGESITEATILRWIKKPGEPVKSGEDIVELESDKVNLAIPAEQDGIVGEMRRNEGDTVGVGEVIGTLAAGKGASASAPAASTAAPVASPSAPVNAGAGANGATVPVPAPASTDGDATNGHGKPMTPVAQRIVRDAGLDVAGIEGSGTVRQGQKTLTKGDVIPALTGTSSVPAISSVTAPNLAPTVPTSPVPLPTTPRPLPNIPLPTPGSDDPRVERRPMTRRRQAIANNLGLAQQTAVMLTTFNEVDMSSVMALRTRRNEAFQKQNGVKLGFMSLFTKAVIAALKAFPLLNAEIQGTDLLVKSYYDIGIAVGVEGGLVVPVVRDADRKTFAEIEKDIAALADKAKNNKLAIDELRGGTFTITNGGTFGSLLSTPILNYPQVGILGMHNIVKRPVVVGDEIVARPMMYIALTYDHRIVDGSEAVRFLVRVKEMIEDPEGLMLAG